MLDAVSGRVGIVKPQVAFFEAFGSVGFAVLERVCQKAREMDLLVIADAKRGDIGSTMDGYGRAWLSETSPFLVDALTVSSYLGPESVRQIIDLALENSKGVFLLAATSNHEANILQSSKSDSGESVALQVANFVSEFNTVSDASVGVVIGANVDRSLFGLTDDCLSITPILAPGFGHQGARLSDLKKTFGTLAANVICSVSRSVAGNCPATVSARVDAALEQLREGY
jgi:orotidine-5'-phosphate decarboxylase